MKKTTIISTCCRSRLPSAVRAGAGRFLPPSSFFQRRQNSSSIHNVDPKSLYGLHLLELNGENFDIPAVPNPPAPNGLLSSTVTFSGFMPDHLDFVSAWSAHAARAHNLHCSDPIHLPTILRRWDVIKGPFAHAKTKEVFERKTYQRAVQILDAQNAEVVRKWANYVVESMPAGVDVNVEYFDWFDSAKSVEKASEELQSSAGKEAEERKALGSLPSTKELSFEEQVLRKRDEFLKLWAKNAGANKGPAKGKKGSDDEQDQTKAVVYKMPTTKDFQALEECAAKVAEFHTIPLVRKKYLLNHATIASRKLADVPSPEGVKRVKAGRKLLGSALRFYKDESDYYYFISVTLVPWINLRWNQQVGLKS